MRIKLHSVVAGLALAAVAAFGAAKPASATPSTLGFYPSSDIYGPGNVHFDFDTYSKSLDNKIATTAGLTYGIGDKDGFLGRTEIGVDYNFTDVGTTVHAGKRSFFNVKTQLYSNTEAQTRLVVGGWGLGDHDTNPNYGYLLASKNFSFGRVHVGVAHAFSKKVVFDHRTSLQLGYDKYITPKLQFAVDYYTGKGTLSGVQPTLYYYVNDKADFGLGYFRTNRDFGPASISQNQIYLCFDYNFDFKGATPAPVPETTTPAPATN